MMNPTAQELASKGRYGDTMLVHMNPEEVAGIASLAPGQMTINPETGLPEAFKFRDFLRFALPIAGSIALPAMAPTLAGSSVFAKAALSGVGSGLGSLLAGSNSDEALASGLTAGLTYGLGSKFLPEGTGDAVNKAVGSPKVVKIPDLPTSGAPKLDAQMAENFARRAPATNFLGRVTENPAGTIGLGLSGAAGALAATPVEAEDDMITDVGLAGPYRRRVRYPGSGFGSREFGYFSPSGIYGASGGYVNKMQEGGEVDPTSPVEDDSLGLMAYAPLIANYPSYDTGVGSMPVMPPTRMETPISTVEQDYGVTPVAAGSGGIGSREPRLGFDSFDNRKAPEGFMYFLANKPGASGRPETFSAPPEYRLTPTKNLSALEMEDLTSRGILMPYRPEGARYIDYQPQVALKEEDGFGGFKSFDEVRAQSMQEGGLATISEGMVSGAGDGMSDNVYGTIDNMQKVALSEGEFIIPADVVSGIGNGSSESGAERLYDMMDRIRKARTGTMQQAPAIDVSVMMPA
tara:strand:+ start:279 stop:1835 length:1557 start_codon:yes stop_codon:yes gene_type:complete